ncbi:tetratricopeptide repeat protein [Caldivirga maquilingensis]|uniref:Tetratricopeptide TPR_2 repeat protein n=1 Tax=Caldivirga maquilingensis (strain ATCC 700844 / DSM 13496 / JCM 10307 / IC-167) TaxID=397948 RepID=A8MD60_CALMQ|nr:tetratricopeptide repeat protein [Caldivirga maquilingensis]ABW01716.1 Tetratricopeptide TPR_2 repeat protein [Caldivirga maquilingensis IC-167]
MNEEYCKALYKAAEASICLMEHSHGLRLYREYLLRCPEIPGAWHGLAICLEAVGDRKEALKAYEKALELNLRRNDAVSLLWGGWCAFKLGRHELAYRLFKESIEKNPNYAYTWHSLAVAAFKLGKREEGEAAMAKYRALIKERPYERRECEGISMLMDSLESLKKISSVDQGIIQVVEDLLMKSITKHKGKCTQLSNYYVNLSEGK